jgi:HEAT repeat protein
LASKIIPKEIIEALSKGLSHDNHRVKSQCLRGISILGDHVQINLISDIVSLFSDPILSSTAIQTARRLITLSHIRTNLEESTIKMIEVGNIEIHRSSSPM